MPYTKTVWTANVTPVTAASMNNIESGIASMAAPAPSTTPPASPADGDIWYLPADAANGVNWQLRYNAGSASVFKWEFVGGPGKVFNYDAGGAVFNHAAYTVASPWYWWVNALGSVFPVPRNGDYDVRCKMYLTSTGSAQTARIAATAVTAVPSVVGPNAAWLSYGTLAAAGELTLMVGARLTGLVSGTHSVGMVWNADTLGTATIKAVWVEITPVRVS